MPKVRQADGTFIDVDLSAIFADDGQNPFVAPTPPPAGNLYTEEDLQKVREDEKGKLYSRLEELQQQVGTLTAAQEAERQRLLDEQAAAEEARRKAEEADLDTRSLFEKRQQEWTESVERMNQDWNQKFEAESQRRELAEAQAAKEREFNNLRDYISTSIETNKERIAPQLIGWINGSSQEEVDAAVARAIATTDEIAAEFQQIAGPPQGQPLAQQFAPVPPVLPGTRTTAPVGADPGTQFQTLTAEQLAAMPMDQYAKLRGQIGVGGQSNNRGMFG